MSPEAYNAEILRELKQIRSDVSELKGMMLVISGGAKASASTGTGASSRGSSADEGGVATDRELDGQWGNPQIKKEPSAKYWQGESFVTCRLSETSAEYLDAFAKWKDACAWGKDQDASKPEKTPEERELAKKYAGYDRKDARLARGWAKRLRDGWGGRGHGPAAPNGGGAGGAYDDQFSSDDDVPFVREESRWWVP